jgi:hypothetical protein
MFALVSQRNAANLQLPQQGMLSAWQGLGVAHHCMFRAQGLHADNVCRAMQAYGLF